MDFFVKPRRFNAKIVNQIKSNLLIVEFKIQKRSPDILWGQLKRKLTSISKQLSNARFEIIKKSCFTDEEERAVFIFMIEFTNLPKISVNKGPQIYLCILIDCSIRLMFVLPNNNVSCVKILQYVE